MGFFDFLFGRKKKAAKDNLSVADKDVIEKKTAKNEVPEDIEAPAAENNITAAKNTDGKNGCTSTKEDTVVTEDKDKKKCSTEESSSDDALCLKNEQPDVQKPQRTGKFEIKKTKDDRYVFNLYASNNVIVATSQIYSSAQSAINGIKSIIANADKAPVEDQTLKDYTPLSYPKWEIYQDNGGQYRFRLNASNGSCVVHSQGYTAKTNCKKGIDSIIKFAKDAEIVKAYLKK